MYHVGPPAGVGVAGGVLAATGAETFGYTILAIAALLAGALLLRAARIRQHRVATGA